MSVYIIVNSLSRIIKDYIYIKNLALTLKLYY